MSVIKIGLKQLLERNHIEYTGFLHIDMDGAKRVMRGMASGKSEALPGSPKDQWQKSIRNHHETHG